MTCADECYLQRSTALTHKQPHDSRRSGTTAGAKRLRRSHTSSDALWAGCIRLLFQLEKPCVAAAIFLRLDRMWRIWWWGSSEKRRRDTEVFVRVRFCFHCWKGSIQHYFSQLNVKKKVQNPKLFSVQQILISEKLEAKGLAFLLDKRPLIYIQYIYIHCIYNDKIYIWLHLVEK